MSFPLKSVGGAKELDHFFQPPPANQPPQPAGCDLKPYERLELPKDNLPNIPRRQRSAVFLSDLASGANEVGRVLLGASKKSSPSSDRSISSSESSDDEQVENSSKKKKTTSTESDSSSESSDEKPVKKSKTNSSSESSDSSDSPTAAQRKQVGIADACLQTKLRVLGAGALAVGAVAQIGKRQLDHDRDQTIEEYQRKLNEGQRAKKIALVQAGFNRESTQQANSEARAVQKETNEYNLNITKELTRRDAAYWATKSDALKTYVKGQVRFARDREQGKNERAKTAAQQALAQRGLEYEHEEKKLDTAAQLIEKQNQGLHELALLLVQQKSSDGQSEKEHAHKMLETSLRFIDRANKRFADSYDRAVDATLRRRPEPQRLIHPMLESLTNDLKGLQFSYESPSDICFEGLSIYQLLTGDLNQNQKIRIKHIFEMHLQSKLTAHSKSGSKITKEGILKDFLSKTQAHEFFHFVVRSTLSCPLNVRTILLGELFKTYTTSFKFLES